MNAAPSSPEAPFDAAQALADRYAAVWNETDPAARKRSIEQLWAPDGRHYVRAIEAHGYDALEERVTGSHDKNVRLGGNTFRTKNAQALRDVVTFSWEMIASSGEVEAVGLEFLVLDARGRILTDYQFILA